DRPRLREDPRRPRRRARAPGEAGGSRALLQLRRLRAPPGPPDPVEGWARLARRLRPTDLLQPPLTEPMRTPPFTHERESTTMTDPMSMFDTASGGQFPMKEHLGDLLVIHVTGFEEDIPTAIGNSDAV